MKLFYAPRSPFARKVQAAAIKLGLAERLQLEYAELVPTHAADLQYLRVLVSQLR